MPSAPCRNAHAILALPRTSLLGVEALLYCLPMGSGRGWSELFWRHEKWATGWGIGVCFVLLAIFFENEASRESGLAGVGSVFGLRALCWHKVGWGRYLGLKTSGTNEYLPSNSPDLEFSVLTMPERLSLWLVPAGYLVVAAFGIAVALGSAFAVGIGSAIVAGIVYRRVKNVNLLYRVSDH